MKLTLPLVFRYQACCHYFPSLSTDLAEKFEAMSNEICTHFKFPCKVNGQTREVINIILVPEKRAGMAVFTCIGIQ